MRSKFLDDLDALVRSHSTDPSQQASEERVISALSAVIVQAAREVVAELRSGSDPGGPRRAAMIRYRPDWDRGGQRGAAMIRYRPDWDRGGQRGAAMIRYRPDWDRGGQRGGAMIRYRPDWERDPRSAAMIRYRPDWERDPRNAAMIRYRPDWDRQAGGDAEQAASGMLEPVLKSLAERLGPGEAARLVQSSLRSLGLSAPSAAVDAPKPDPATKKGKA